MKTDLIQKILDSLFPSPTIPLSFSNPFTLLIAVLLSAQCTDARVNKVTPVLFSKATTPQQMSQLSIEEISTIIHSCGLSNTKARNIKNLSHQITTRFKGKVPASFKELESLPGVGHKTASVVMVQAFHKPAFPIDTHIFRIAKRWGLSQGKTVSEVEKDLKKQFPQKHWGKLHLQMILYARSFCQARNHSISQCPICAALTDNM